MGSVTDFFKATKGYTYCDMLQAANKHLWSPDGVEWYAVKFDSRAGGSYNGGSALGWPRGNGLEGDERQYLSMWGSNYGQNGGCCSTSYSESKTGNFPIAFDMYYSPDAVPLPVGVTLLADVSCRASGTCRIFRLPFFAFFSPKALLAEVDRIFHICSSPPQMYKNAFSHPAI